MTERSSFDPVEYVDWISKLPNDVLVLILTKLSTVEAIRTSVVSKRWEHVWKHMPHLVLDMQKTVNPTGRYIIPREKLDVSKQIAPLITKIINNHCGHLESCVIDHYSYQYEDGTLNTWIQSLKTKCLTLIHQMKHMVRIQDFLDFPPNSFSYPNLASLSLKCYVLETPLSFNNCQNLKTLKLLGISASEVELFNKVLTSCPSLEVLVLGIFCFENSGPLKIENNRLKLLKLWSCNKIDGIQVSSTSLHILDIETHSCGKDYFILTSPRLKFHRNSFWLARTDFSHIMYTISQEEKCVGHEEFLVNIYPWLAGTALSVSVDLTNPIEVERLRQFLLIFSYRMEELEILFKNNNTLGESESTLWEENHKDPFHIAEFSVDTLWMHNFSGSKEEFAFASRLIKQGRVARKMMIRTTSYPAKKKLEIERAVAKLKTFQRKDQWELLSIICF